VVRPTVLLLLVALAPPGPKVDARQVVARARQYLIEWQQQLAAIVAEEHYEQQVLELPAAEQFARSSVRRLESEVLLIRSPAGGVWLSFRDVMVVDDVPVRDRRHRFDELFSSPNSKVIASARRIADESARYNVGRWTRNVNTPTTTLIFLNPEYADNTTFRRDADEELHGTAVAVIRFDQRRAPFAIRQLDGTPQPASGRIWVEADSGRILRTSLNIQAQATAGRVTVDFGRVSGLDVMVPFRMEDEYQMRDIEHVRGVAVYSNHRRFQTGARLIVPPDR
jgi:hypothetical protein